MGCERDPSMCTPRTYLVVPIMDDTKNEDMLYQIIGNQVVPITHSKYGEAGEVGSTVSTCMSICRILSVQRSCSVFCYMHQGT